MNDDFLIRELEDQFEYFLKNVPCINEVPRSYSEINGIRMASAKYWTCGFTPGSMWYMYELTGNEKWKKIATANTLKFEEVKNQTGTHDLGFIIFCSYGNAYRITNISEYKNIIIHASETLTKRFSPVTGCIRSWDWGAWEFPVIVDNLMNLEMLFWASEMTGNSKFKDIAVSHADKTMEHHYRKNYSSYHVVDYDPKTGKPKAKETHQGAGDESSWARGQAWGLYGFAVCYRETKNIKYLDFAQNIAKYLIDESPEDMIPYWDYDVADNLNEPRDASSAAIIASAFYGLARFSSDNKNKYINFADRILHSLNSVKYRSKIGTNGGFLLMHSTGNKPKETEVDSSINYTDYYYLEALKRQKEIKIDG